VFQLTILSWPSKQSHKARIKKKQKEEEKRTQSLSISVATTV